jgi:16S rRNA (guanine527-N7)-methyltransferase
LNAASPGAGPDSELTELIASGAARLGLALEPEQVSRLVSYLRLIARWNETYNLTSIRDPRAMAPQHIVDCLAAAAALQRRRPAADRRYLVDVGSGAGLPGVVVAIALPETDVVCVDSVGKKAAFVTHAAASLGVGNVSALHARVERLRDRRFDVVASRAFASLPDFVAETQHLLAENGEWLAMKGKAPASEIAALRGVDAETEPIVVPGLAANRCIVWMRRHE